MSPRLSSHRHVLMVVFLCGGLSTASHAATQTYQDGNVLNTWNTTDLNWDAGAATWTDGNDAVFAGTGEAVTVGAVSVHNLQFDSTGYTLSGGTITLTGVTPTFTANQGAVIGSIIAGTSLTKNGAGALTLSGVNTYSGGTTIADGTLVASNTAALGTGMVTLSGGTLQLATDTSHASRNVTVGGNAAIVLDRATAGAGFTTTFGTLTFNDTFTLSVSKGANVTSGTATLNFTGFPALGAAGKTAGFNVGAGAEVHLSGSLTGTQAFAKVDKSGAGTLILSGNNNYWDPAGNTGLVTISGGTLDLRSQNAMGDGTNGGNSIALSMAAGTTLRIGTDTALGNYANTTLTGDGATILADRATAGAGLTNQFNTLAVNGAYTLNVLGGSNVTSGTAQVNFNATTLAGNATFNVVNPAAGATVMNIAGVVGESGGARSLTKSGSGRLNLASANTYTGGTTVNGGVLALGTGGATGTIRGTLTVNTGASVVYTAANPFGYTAGVSVNVLNINGGTVGNAGFGNHFWNSFQLNMTGGTLNLGGTINEFLSPTVTVAASGTTAQILAAEAGAVLRLRDGTSGTFNVADGAQAVDLLVSAPITYGSANSGITKTGAGAMQLTGASTYTGNTTVSGGTLKISGAGRIYSNAHSTAVVTVQTGGVLELDTWSYSGTTQSLGMLAAGAGQIVVDNGTLRMNGATTYGRGVTVNAGGATLDAAAGANWTLDTVNDNTAWVYNGNPSLTFTGAGTGAFQKVFSGTGAVTKSGAGTWTLSGVNTYTGATTISAGTLEIGGAGQLGAGTYAGAITNNGTLQVNSSANQTLSGTMTGTGAVIKAGGGTLTFSTQKTYTGGTTVNGGILDLTGGGGAAGTIRGIVTVNSGATLRLSANDVTGYATDATRLSTINLAGGTLHVATTGGTGQNQTLGSATINMTGAAITGVAGSNLDFFAGGSALNTLASATSSTISGVKLNIRQTSVTFTVADGAAATDLDVSSQIYGGTLIKSGAGSMRMSGPNTYTGDTTINAGTLELAGSGQLGAGNYAGAIGNAGTLVINTTANQTLSGTLTGAGSLVKNNTGLLTLSTPKAYTGSTTVNGGELAVNGTGTLSGTSGLSVAAGATFSYLPAAVGGTLAMGAGSTLGLGNVSTLGLNWNTTTSSKISALGAAVIGSGVQVSMTGAFTSGTPYTLLTAGSGLDSGSYTAINNTDYTAAFTLTPTSVILTPTAVTALTSAYWKGGTPGNAAVMSVAGNWTTDGAGTISAVTPGAAANVFFSDGGAAAGDQVNMTLGVNMAMNSITVNGASGTPANTNPVSLLGGGPNTLTLGSTTGSGITVNTGAGAVTLDAAIVLGNAQTWANHSAGPLTVNGVVSGAAAAGLTKDGSGVLVLSGANTYSGGTTVNAGMLTAYAGSAAGAKTLLGTGTVTVNSAGTVRLLADSTANAMSYANNFALNNGTLIVEDAGVTMGGTLALTGASTINVVYAGKSVSFSNVVGGAGSVTKTGPGWLWFDNTGNTFSGGTTVSAGTFAINAGTAAGAKSSFGTGDVTINSGGTVRVYAGSTGNAMSYANNFNLNGGALRSEDAVVTYGGAITLTGANTVDVVHAGKNAIFANPVGGAGSLSKTGNGTLILAANNTYGGPTTILGGPLQIGNGGTTGTLGADAGVIANSGTLLFNRSDAVSLDNVVTGTGGVSNIGTGSLTLNGTQTYTGDTIVSQGTVNLATGALNGTARIVVGVAGGAGTPVFNMTGGSVTAGTAGTGNAIYLGTAASLPGSFSISGGTFSTTSTSAFITVGDNAVGTYTQTGGTVSTGSASGQLWMANNGGGTGSVFNLSGGTFNAAGGAVLGVRGSYTFTVSGTGVANIATIQLGHTGGTTNNPTGRVINLNGGTLQLTNGFNYQSGTAVVNLNGGTLKAGASSTTFWNNNASVTATLGAGGGVVDSNGFNITVNQVLGGAGALTKTGAGVLTLGGANVYTGATNVNGGGLTVSGAGTLAGTTALSVAGGAEFRHLPAVQATVLTLGAGATMNLASGSIIGQTFGSTIAAPGAATVGSGVFLQMSGAYVLGNTYNVLTAAGGLDAGTFNLQLMNNTDFSAVLAQSPTAVTVTPVSQAPITTAYWKGGLPGGPSVWGLSGATASNWTLDGAGAPTSVVPGAAANVFFSDTGAVAGDQVNMTLGASMAVNSLTFNGPNPASLLNTTGQTLTLGGSAGAGITVGPGGGAVTLNPAVTLAGAQTWTNDSANTLTLTGAVTGSGLLTVGGAGNTLLSGNLNNGAAGLTKTGAGLLTLTGVNGNAFTGPVTVAGGTLLLDNGNGSTTHYTSAIFNINGPSTLTFKSSAGGGSRNDLNARTFTFDATGGGTVDTTGPMNWVVSNCSFVTNGGAMDTLATAINLNAGTITFNTAVRGTGAVDLDVTGAMGNSNAAVTKSGPGIARFGGANNYNGATAVNAGTLILANPTALGSTTGGTTVAAGAVLDLNGQSVGAEALTLNGTGILAGGALINSSAVAAGLNGNLAMATASSIGGSGDITLGGVVSGPALEKVGAGTLTLSNANTFTGTATVSQGGLLIMGATPAAGLINVAASATLGGGGSGGVATLADGATLSPGATDENADNLFTLAGLSMSETSIFRVEVKDPAGTYYTDPNEFFYTDHVTVNGALTLNGRLLMVNRPDYDITTAVAGNRWLVASYTGALTDNTLEIDPASAPLAPGLVYQVNTTSNPGYVYVEVAVPEAGSAALLALGLGLLLRRRFR